MKYILVLEAKRKNAKRHIAARGNDIAELEKRVGNPKSYKYAIYNSKWELVKIINE